MARTTPFTESAAELEAFGVDSDTPTFLRVQPQSPVTDVDGLSRLLCRSRSSILSDRTRAPDRVPPAYVAPGSRTPLWIVSEVLDWLRAHPEHRRAAPQASTRRPGRPTKVEQRLRRARHA